MAKRELLASIQDRYQGSSKRDKGRILDEFIAEAVCHPLRPLQDADTQVLNSLVARRQQVMTMSVAERNRLPVPLRLSGPASKATSPGSSRSWTAWTKACARPSTRVLYGGRKTTCCAAHLASENRSLLPFWHTCPNWALSTADRSLPWLAWHPSTGIAVPCGANAPSGEAGPGSARLCTWGRWLPADSTRSSGTSTSVCCVPANRKSWL